MKAAATYVMAAATRTLRAFGTSCAFRIPPFDRIFRARPDALNSTVYVTTWNRKLNEKKRIPKLRKV